MTVEQQFDIVPYYYGAGMLFFLIFVIAATVIWPHWFRALNLRLPFRMALGRFGIWLSAVGRVLQIRYANWNREFRLKHEFAVNKDICQFHVSEPVTDKMILTFNSPTSQRNKVTPMVIALFGIKGVTQVSLEPYEITIKKGSVFHWGELSPDIERIILEHLVVG